MTAAAWIKGTLSDDYDVPVNSVAYVPGARRTRPG